MFDNIGGKIKTLARAVCGAGIALSVVYGLFLIVSGIGSYYGGGSKVLTGILVMLIGSFASWIGSFFTYGFGELIENSEEIRRNTYGLRSQSTVPTYPKTGNSNSGEKLRSIITGKTQAVSKPCPHCGAIVSSSPCEMCGKEF